MYICDKVLRQHFQFPACKTRVFCVGAGLTISIPYNIHEKIKNAKTLDFLVSSFKCNHGDRLSSSGTSLLVASVLRDVRKKVSNLKTKCLNCGDVL